MRGLGGTLALRPGLARPSEPFVIGLEVPLWDQRPQRDDHLGGMYAPTESLCLLRDRQPHAMRGWSDGLSDILEGAGLGHGRAMHAAQRRQPHRQ